MTDARDEQDTAEQLDPDVLAVDDVETYDDPEGELVYPPDRPLGARAYGTTPAEERVDEPLDERVQREVRDPLDTVEEPDLDELSAIEAEGLLADEVVDLDLDEVELDGDEEIVRERAVGRLIEPGADDDGVDYDDVEADAVATSVAEDDLSAEEQAIHITADPPYGEPGDGYLEE